MKILDLTTIENITERDLVWFFNHAEADCGLKSNWSAMVSAACFGGTSYQDTTNSFILNSVGHYRELEKIYKTLSSTTQEILFASFADIHISDNIVKIFSKYAGAACCLSIDNLAEFDAMCARVNERKASANDKMRISKIRMESIKNYNEVIAAYVHLKYENSKRNKHVKAN